MALTGPKEMMTSAAMISDSYDGSYFVPVLARGNWDYEKVGSYHYWTQVRKIDLAMFHYNRIGLQLEAVALQKPWNPVLLFTKPDASLMPSPGRVNLEYYVSSTPPWTDATSKTLVLNNDGQGNVMTFNLMGRPQDGLDWEQTMVGSNTTWTNNSNVGLSSRGWMSALNSQLYGSNKAVAAKCLYVTFIWVVEDPISAAEPAIAASLQFPPLRIVLAGTAFKTKRKQWLDLLTRNVKIEPVLP